ncbi:MAG: nucleotide exchange factor GrpE [Firmicutes bacterium]|nr:nucleotide exchange factor GrpE [Bacillota bacterium]
MPAKTKSAKKSSSKVKQKSSAASGKKNVIAKSSAKQPPEIKTKKMQPETLPEAPGAGEFRSPELVAADLKELACSIENVESLNFLKPRVESADPGTITPDNLIGYYRMACRCLKEEIDNLESKLNKLQIEYKVVKEASSFIHKENGTQVSEDIKEEINRLKSKINAREGEIDALREQNNSLLKEISDYQETIKRMSADFTNFRERQKQANEKLVEYASEQLISRILPVLDNFDLAIKSSRQNNDFEAMAKGVEMIQSQLNEILMKEGLVPINCRGDFFDPAYHEVLMEEKTNEYQEGTIIEDIRRGFLLKDKLLRPSLVKVAKSFNEEETPLPASDSVWAEEFLIEEPVDEGSNEEEGE